MLLAIDIGNSTVACGLFENGTLKAAWHLPSDPALNADTYHRLLSDGVRATGSTPEQVRGIALCSVVPALTPVIETAATLLCSAKPLVVTTEMEMGLTLRYRAPRELGVDRLVGAAFAYARRRTWLMVVDLGTATTFSVVGEAGEFLGGAIAPGLGISAEALASRTAQLPAVDLVRPPTVIGRDARAGIQSGLLFGHAALVDGMIERMQEELGLLRTPLVLATGGHAHLIGPLSRTIREVHPHLTLDGLAWLHHGK
jgi:type III pantothenate kinase